MTKNTLSGATTNYNTLTAHFESINHFEHFSALGDWDQAVMMPSGGNEARGNAMAELAKHIHELKTAPMLSDTLAKAKEEPLTFEQQANLREMQYAFTQASVLPSKLVQAKTQAAYQCENAWRQQRIDNDWQGFKPNLTNVINLVKEEAAIRADAQGMNAYDTLLDKFEPGMNTEKLSKIFNDVSSWLPALIAQIGEQQRHETSFTIPTASSEKQALLGRDVMSYLGFDFNHGRLDLSSHPFCGGVPGDVRLTTRFDENDFTSGMMGVVHETGHARYEQGLPLSYRGQPAGKARSMGIHESQSLFMEMQVGRGNGFLSQMLPKINQHLNCDMSLAQLNNIYSRVKPGHIRVDADEVTYPCHIMLRFEAEKALIDGSLSVADLPEFWSANMQSLLGINTDGDYRNGCMQDIHWAVGELGYFPSYSLGAMYAAQLRFALESQLGDMDALIGNGEIQLVQQWLADNIWSKGSLLTTDELITQATGETLNPEFFKRHVMQRYLK